MLRLVAGISLAAISLLGATSSARADACMCAPDANVTGPDGSPVLVLLEGDAARQEVPGQDGVLWCIDGDDPRCMPTGGRDSDPPRTITPSSPTGGAGSTAPTPDPDVRDVRPALDEDGARSGVRYRVERPPR